MMLTSYKIKWNKNTCNTLNLFLLHLIVASSSLCIITTPCFINFNISIEYFVNLILKKNDNFFTLLDLTLPYLSSPYIVKYLEIILYCSIPVRILYWPKGRLPIRVTLKGLNEEDLYRILTEPVTNLIRQQIEMLKSESVTLSFTDGAIREIARVAFEVEIYNIESVYWNVYPSLLCSLSSLFFYPILSINCNIHFVMISNIL